MSTHPIRSYFGGLAMAMAMSAFALAFLTDWSSYLSANEPKSLVSSAKEMATNAAGSAKERVLGWFKDDEPTVAPPVEKAPEIDWKTRGKGASVLLAVCAVLLASLGFVRRENPRLITAAMALASAALAYQFVIKGLLAMFAGLMVAAVLGFTSRKNADVDRVQ